MLLIELFSDYIFNKKDLREYVELRKDINERGEFNDQMLIRIQENLERFKEEDSETLELMYKTLDEYVKNNRGIVIEYPINFARAILSLYKNNGKTPRNIYENYENGLNHHSYDG